MHDIVDVWLCINETPYWVRILFKLPNLFTSFDWGMLMIKPQTGPFLNEELVVTVKEGPLKIRTEKELTLQDVLY